MNSRLVLVADAHKVKWILKVGRRVETISTIEESRCSARIVASLVDTTYIKNDGTVVVRNMLFDGNVRSMAETVEAVQLEVRRKTRDLQTSSAFLALLLTAEVAPR